MNVRQEVQTKIDALKAQKDAQVQAIKDAADVRLATHSENLQNCGLTSRNTSGAKGVYFNKRDKRWMARIGAKGKCIYLGNFLDKTVAATAYANAAKELHPYRPGA